MACSIRIMAPVATMAVATVMSIGITIGAPLQPAMAQTQTLYNPTAQKLPGSQPGWVPQVPAGATQTLIPTTGATELNTNLDLNLQAGYAKFSPKLDRTKGYTIRIDLQLLSEAHSSNHRAGFSLIAVSADLRAIELGFWTNRVWVQKDTIDGALFTQGEGFDLNTTQANRYDLVVQGEKYCLFVNQQATPSLKGRLRNYSSFGLPYSLGNFLFIGDNTKSARGVSRIGRIEFTPQAIRTCP